jgi:hypothetical protein
MNIITPISDKAFESNLLTDGTKLAGTMTDLLTTVQQSENKTAVDRIFLECAWTDLMKKMLDLGNALLLDNFRLDLTLEDNK